MSLTQTWTLRAVYGTLFISVAVIFIVFAPRAPWPSKFWKPSFDIAHAQSTSPSASSSPLRPPPVWLIVTVSAAKNFARRDIVRATWQSLYKTSGLFDTRFVISNPGEALLPIIEYENRTHGDLIVLNNLEETRHTANRVKTIEFFRQFFGDANTTSTSNTKNVIPNRPLNPPWRFISKVDDDSFLLPNTFYDVYLRPRLNASQDTNPNISSTLFAAPLPPKFENEISPCGQFYTLTYDLVEAMIAQYAKTPYTDVHEDRLVGRLLSEGKIPFEFVELKEDRVFDLGINGVPGPGSMEIHRLKSDEQYLNIASVFGEEGFKAEVARTLGVEYGGKEEEAARRWFARQRLRRGNVPRC